MATIGFDGSRITIKNRTGTENYSYLLLKHLLSVDHSNRYTIYSRVPLNDPALEASRATNKLISWPRLWTQGGLAIEVLKNQPDLLFIPAHTLPVIHHPSLKTVVTIHDLGYEYLPQHHQFPAKLYLNRSTEYAAKHATRLIAVSQFTKQDLINKLHTPAEKVSVIYEGVDLQANQRPAEQQIARVKELYKLDKPYILFVGTIQPRKNLINLIKAFSMLSQKDTYLVLAGNRGWLSDEIYQAPIKYQIQDRVKFLGYIPDANRPALYGGALLTALVSYFEGFGLPVLESMACGTPVIAAKSSSLPEVVGDAGELVDPNDTDDIAAGLKRLIEDEDLRRRYVEAGYLQAAKFSWNDAAQQTLKLFEELLG